MKSLSPPQNSWKNVHIQPWETPWTKFCSLRLCGNSDPAEPGRAEQGMALSPCSPRGLVLPGKAELEQSRRDKTGIYWKDSPWAVQEPGWGCTQIKSQMDSGQEFLRFDQFWFIHTLGSIVQAQPQAMKSQPLVCPFSLAAVSAFWVSLILQLQRNCFISTL